MRNFFLPEVAEVVLTQAPQVSHEATSRRGQEAMPGAELSEIDIPCAVSILIRLPQVNTKLAVVFERLNPLLMHALELSIVHAWHHELGSH